VIELREVALRHATSTADVLSGVTLSISPRCRVAVVGRNGSGKSTLLAALTGGAGVGGGSPRLAPRSGEVRVRNGLRVAYFDQQEVEALLHEPPPPPLSTGTGTPGVGKPATAATPLSHLQRVLGPEWKEQALRGQLGAFGVKGDMATRPLTTLSGGQRARVAFARLAASEPHLLIADEPTNHLDMASIDALTEALRAFAGGVVLVSHNRTLLRAVAEEVWVVRKKAVTAFHGSVDEYYAPKPHR